jgi:glycosyltransferase involved in cell wall biosynthesis
MAFGKVSHQIAGAQLRIAGECSSDPAYVETVKEAIRRTGLQKNVHLLGGLSQEKVLEEYANCKLLALPSSQETSPVVIAQAMAAGKPVVATPVGGVAEMIGEDGERGLLVPLGDVACLADAILNLFHCNALSERLGRAGRTFALENYHPDCIARRTAEVYQTVIAQETGGHA